MRNTCCGFIAINGFADNIYANDWLHTPLDYSTPNLNSGNILTGYVQLDNGVNMSSGALWRGVDAVSYVLMQDSIANQYIANDSVGAATGWVVTFPTKIYYAYPGFSNSATVLPPFTSLWNGSGACEVVLLDAAFLEQCRRATAINTAREAGCSALILHAEATPDLLRRRIAARSAAGSDASEAGLAVLEHQLAAYEPLTDDESVPVITCDTGQDPDIERLATTLRDAAKRDEAA